MSAAEAKRKEKKKPIYLHQERISGKTNEGIVCFVRKMSRSSQRGDTLPVSKDKSANTEFSPVFYD